VTVSQPLYATQAMMPTGGLLDAFWVGRRADEFDQGCMRG